MGSEGREGGVRMEEWCGAEILALDGGKDKATWFIMMDMSSAKSMNVGFFIRFLNTYI
jgi:hypothetical protein